jgi:hypothetical protein
MRCGWPAIVTVLTRDQYGEVVHVSGLKVRWINSLAGCSDVLRNLRRESAEISQIVLADRGESSTDR